MIALGVALAALATLVWMLAERRGWVPRRGLDRRRPTIAHHLLAAVVLAACNSELLAALALPRPILSGDLRSHAMVAREIAAGHAAAGWVDVYHSGFPLGPHYPSVGWLLAAGLMRLGVSAPWAVFTLGVGAAVATSALLYAFALRVGAPFWAALLGACTLALAAPFSSFLGGPPAVLVMGVLAQVVAIPIVMVSAYEVLAGRSRAALVISSALAVAAHPQIAANAMVLLGAVSIVSGRLAQWVRALVATALAGAGIFGFGLATLGVPFGWPPLEGWLRLGRPPSFFLSFLAEGEVFDFERAPIVTTVIACALVLLVLRVRAAYAARAALVGWAAALALCLSGAPLSHMGRLGSLLLGFFQPLRAYALLPIASAAVVSVAATELARAARAVAVRTARPLRRVVLLLPTALVAAEVVPLVPLQLPEARGRLHAFDAGPCGVGTPKGYDPAAVNAALAGLGDGRLAYDPKGLLACATMTDLDFASRAPIASPFVVGAHVGVIATAFDSIKPTAPGSDRRASVLGVGSLLLPAALPPPTGDGWSVRQRLGPVTLYETSASYFGLGCRRELWRGDDRHLREALGSSLVDPASEVWSPTDWIELDAHGTGPVVRVPVQARCDASQARLLEAQRVAPGRYRARVASPVEVDLVLRETFFDSWDIEVDGVRTKPVLVAPGFMSVHLASGQHLVTARFRTSWGYLLGLALAAAAVAALARGASRRSRRV